MFLLATVHYTDRKWKMQISDIILARIRYMYKQMWNGVINSEAA